MEQSHEENADWLLEDPGKFLVGISGGFGFRGPHRGHGFGDGSLGKPTQQSSPQN